VSKTNPIDSKTLTEDAFKQLLPEDLQKVSKTHFTPMGIAKTAIEWLTEDGKKNILDIGAGVGKFCIVGALNSDSFFYGVEYRASLAQLANELIEKLHIKNAVVKHQNILDIDFLDFNAFYLYNPFYENIVYTKRLNNEMPLADSLYRAYIRHTALQLEYKEKGTRVVTYHGDNLEIPESYEKIKQSKNGLLKLWVKQH